MLVERFLCSGRYSGIQVTGNFPERNQLWAYLPRLAFQTASTT